jgi:hypothetical protein
MFRLRTFGNIFSFLLILAIGVTACGGEIGLGPDNQLEVTNATDNFQFQVSNMESVSETLSYTWQNTGTQATIDISQAITAGSAILTIEDADGTVVHQEDIADDNDTDTAVGVAGSWTIKVEVQSANGTFNFRVQRRT